MEQFKRMINKITSGTKLRKDQLLIMILAGILLCILAIPVKKPDSETTDRQSQFGISYSGNDMIEKNSQAQGDTAVLQQADIDYDLSYTGYWEEKLRQSLSRIDGAGEVEVLITLKESEERILGKDIPEEVKETLETDAEGGSRTVTERQTQESTIYTVNEAGQSVPYVQKIVQPVVEGVVVIAQGGDSEVVKDNIIETIQVLFGMDTNKIRVVKMKSKN
ncbi:MAG: stage III sporulation protein AG [Blautia sp.]|nr:stage III sporulation protein AG [Lachnoclostridium sp.]MCM1210700.1 stage III sporulation protein AG [Blautia sp.]